MKQKHSEFYYKLQTLNDKIYVFRTHFYTKMPAYQRAFLEKKQKKLEERLQQQKAQFEKEMAAIQEKINRRMKSSMMLPAMRKNGLRSSSSGLQKDKSGALAAPGGK